MQYYRREIQVHHVQQNEKFRHKCLGMFQGIAISQLLTAKTKT
jgi:hypothetical protein